MPAGHEGPDAAADGADLDVAPLPALDGSKRRAQMESTILATLLLGLVLGMQHALDADHLVAVSTIVSRHRNPLKASVVGLFWGIGHTTTLFLAGLAVFAFRLSIPERLALSMEFLVGIVLVVLGAQIFWQYRALKVHAHRHEHEDEEGTHLHFHSHAEDPEHGHGHVTSRRKSLMVGMIHGMAGSAALMLIVLSTISSAWEGMAYILIFGFGSIAGMMAVSMLIGLPFALSARRFASLNTGIRLAAGVLSIALGVMVMYEIGFSEGLIYQV